MEQGWELYERFQKGDEQAFAELMTTHKDGLIFFIYRYVQNIDVAEDLSEDVFVALLMHRRRFKGEASFKTYLYTIGRNKAVDWLRKNRRVRNQEEEGRIPDLEEDLEERVIKNERDRQLHGAIAKLKPEYAQVLHLLYFDGLTQEGAGKIMKKNSKQMENLAYRARKALKKILEKEGIGVEK